MRKILVRLQLAMAMTLMIALTSATFPLTLSAPVLVNAHTQLNYENAMLKEEDIFRGEFSQKNLNLISFQPQEVSFSINPIMDVSNVEVRFIFPGDLVRGSIVRAQGHVHGGYVWRGDVKKDETVTLDLSIIADKDIEASVRAHVEASPSGKTYRSSYYLHVSTLTQPEIAEGNAGSTRQVSLPEDVMTPPNAELPRAVEDAQLSSDPSSPGTIRIKGRFVYVNEDGGYSPARWMLVWIRDEDIGEDDWVAYQWAGWDGEFDITCNNDDGFLQDGRDPYAQLWAEGAWDWITKTSGGDTYYWNNPKCGDDVPDGFFHDYGSRVPVSGNEALQAGDAVFSEAQWIYNTVGWYRSKVTIRWPEGTWPHSHGDEIHLPDKATAGWGHITVHHEEGHCVMWALYGHWPPGSGPSPHYVFSESSGGFAICEGWAEFMQCAVDNVVTNLQDWYGGHGGHIETNDWFNCIDTGDMDGGIVEGSVASIFWDILDPASTADKDSMYWGFEEMFTVMRFDQPDSMDQFWTKWTTRWPTLSTSKGPLCTIYWHYGIDKDTYAPHEGSISIEGGATYTKSTSVTLTLSASDWGSGVTDMHFSNVYPYVWSSWYTYATSKSWTLSAGDGTKTAYVQFKDGKGYLSSVYSDTIILDTVPPTTTITHYPGSSTVSLSATDPSPGSGVDKTYYRIDGGSWITYTAPFTLTDTGTHTIDYYSVDKAGNTETTKSQKVHYLTVNTDPAGITTISGTGWYSHLIVATTGTAPATVTSGGKTYTFSTWKVDGTAVNGNPISVAMDAPHTATATYVEAVTATITIDTDKTTYTTGDNMTIWLGLKNPGADLPVRLIIALMLPTGSFVIVFDVTLTLPAGLDTRFILCTLTLPAGIPSGNYAWVACLFDPKTLTLISFDYTVWSLTGPAAPMTAAILNLPVKIP